MRKLLWTPIICGALVLVLSSCNFMGMSRNDDDDDYFLTSKKYEDVDASAEKKDYRWVLKPTIQASNIISPDLSQINPDLTLNKAYYYTSVIYNNGKYGLIDYDGKLLVEPDYDYYYICSCGDIVLYDMADKQITRRCSIKQNSEIVDDTKMHPANTPQYFWDESTEKVYVKYTKETYAKEFKGDRTVVAVKTSLTKISDNEYAIPAITDPAYALIKSNKIVLGFDYEDYYAASFRKNKATAIALKKDGKWGYVSEDGDEILPFEFDGIMSAYVSNNLDNEGVPHPYLFSEGKVAVSKDSNCYYYDMEGNCIAFDGEFDQIRPVINGRAWVKYNGKWGVIRLGEIKDISKMTSHTTTTTKAEKSKKSTKNSSKTTTSTKSNTKKKTAKAKKAATAAKTKKATTKKVTQAPKTTRAPATTAKTKPVTKATQATTVETKPPTQTQVTAPTQPQEPTEKEDT